MKRNNPGSFPIIEAFLVLTAVGVALLIFVGAGGHLPLPGALPLPGPAASMSSAAQTYTVRTETFRDVIEIAATIEAAQEQTLQVIGDGKVTAVYVREGERVKKGQTILQQDDTEQQYQLANHDYAMDQKRIAGAQRELALMQKQRAVLVQRIEDRKIIAQFDGIIAQFTTKPGDVFEIKDSVGVIVDRSYLKATVEVVETDAPKLRPGQAVSLTFPAYTGTGRRGGPTVITGRVHSFPAVAAKTSRGASVVKAEIRVDDPPEVILPGYSFTGEIEIQAPQDVILVERAAIARQDGETYAMRLLPDGTPERITVEAVPYGRDLMRILSGAAPGDVLQHLTDAPPSGQGGGTQRVGGGVSVAPMVVGGGPRR